MRASGRARDEQSEVRRPQSRQATRFALMGCTYAVVLCLCDSSNCFGQALKIQSDATSFSVVGTSPAADIFVAQSESIVRMSGPWQALYALSNPVVAAVACDDFAVVATFHRARSQVDVFHCSSTHHELRHLGTLSTFSELDADRSAIIMMPHIPDHVIDLGRVLLRTSQDGSSLLAAVRRSSAFGDSSPQSISALFGAPSTLDLYQIDIATGTLLGFTRDVKSILSCQSGIDPSRIDVIDVVLLDNGPVYMLAWHELEESPIDVDDANAHTQLDVVRSNRNWYYSIMRDGAVIDTLVGGVVTNSHYLHTLINNGTYVRTTADTVYLRTDAGWRATRLCSLRIPSEFFVHVRREEVPERVVSASRPIDLRVERENR